MVSAPGARYRRGDFAVSAEVLRLVPVAVIVGVLAALTALVLLLLIGFITNLLYNGTVSPTLSPPTLRFGILTILIPVGGGLVIGLMARYGSERIRGHGIPEAMETILVGGSRIEPRLAILKPISSAISIGTGGPFGAEGPIILTGGALGSILGQFLHLTAAERRSLLVGGAAAGMSAVFGTPVAAVLLAVELLLFEWRPRSLILVATASAVAAIVRMQFVVWGLMRPAPLFPVAAHAPLAAGGDLMALGVGVAGGVLAWVLTGAVYGAEDAFARLPVHWAWWPAIGAVVVGAGGMVDPHALGVGYDSIGAELTGSMAVDALLGLLIVKLVIWSVALGSGTSGGILAPVLMLGGAMGALLGHVLPAGTPAIWALIGLAAALAGVTRSPFTAVVFALELTKDVNLLLPLLIAAVAAHAVSVLVLRRSILTEKVARRGFHVTRDYAIDPFEALFVREVMTGQPLTVREDDRIADLFPVVARSGRPQRLYPVLTGEGTLTGVLTWSALHSAEADGDIARTARDVMLSAFRAADPTMTLRELATLMVESAIYTLPVVDPADRTRLLGLVSQNDLLRAHERTLDEERGRRRVFRIPAGPWRRRRGDHTSARDGATVPVPPPAKTT